MGTTDPDRDDFARRLARAREEAELTQEDVAGRFGLNKATVSAWETGRGVPDALRLRDIARLYKRTPDALLNGKEAAWPFSADLLDAVSALDDDARGKLENVMRAHLGRPAPAAEPDRSYRQPLVVGKRKPDRKTA